MNKRGFFFRFVLCLSLLAPVGSFAIEFHRCIDSSGKPHYTHLPIELLDSDCQLRMNYQDYQLEKQYQAIHNRVYLQHLKSQQNNPNPDESPANNEPVQDESVSALSLSDENVDAALNNLIKHQAAKSNFTTKFFKARTRAVETILEAEKPVNPPSLETLGQP